MTTAVTQEHIRGLDATKLALMTRPDSAFFMTIAFSLRHVWDSMIPTAATDGRSIFFNPKFFMSLTVAERIFVLIHECMHVAYLHMLRLKNFPNKAKANMAADYVINLQLVDRGFTMPACGLLDRQYAGMSTEQVYALLPDRAAQDFDMDVLEGDPSLSDEQITQDVQDILVRASVQSKIRGDKPGTIPGDIENALENILNPRLPWNRVLQKYLNSFVKNDYSFKTPNRRFFPKYHMPSLTGVKLMDLAVAVDISGSVSDADFNVFVSEVHSILRMMKPEKITFIQFDTKLQHVDEIHSVQELLALTFTGRGGTDVHPVLEWAKQKKPQLLLIFSDGEFRIPTGKAPTETLWVIHNNQAFKPNFGKVIHYKI